MTEQAFFDFGDRNPTDVGNVVNGYLDILSERGSDLGRDFESIYKNVICLTTQEHLDDLNRPYLESLIENQYTSNWYDFATPHQVEYDKSPNFQVRFIQSLNSNFLDQVVAIDKENGLVFVFNHDERSLSDGTQEKRDGNFEEVLVFDYGNSRMVEINNPDSDERVDQVIIREFDFETPFSINEDYKKLIALRNIYDQILSPKSNQDLLDNATEFITLNNFMDAGLMTTVFINQEGDWNNPNEKIKLAFSGPFGQPKYDGTGYEIMDYIKNGNFNKQPISINSINCTDSSPHNHTTIRDQICNANRFYCDQDECVTTASLDGRNNDFYAYSTSNKSEYVTRPDIDKINDLIKSKGLLGIQRQDIFPNK